MALRPTAETIVKKPKAAIITSDDQTVVDATGRTLVYRKLSLLESARLMRACGEHASNSSFYSLASLVASIRSIDNAPLPFPKNINEIDGRIGMVGDDGATALMKILVPDVKLDEDGEIIDVEAEIDPKEQLKN
jgi:hypothetical protein